MGCRLRLQPAGRAHFASAKGQHCLDGRSLGKSCYPDLVVHQRAIPNNLLAIEVRKSANHQPLEHDQHKLRALTDPHLWFAYWIGVLLTLGKTQVTTSEIYTSGVFDQALSGWFAGRLKDAGLSAG